MNKEENTYYKNSPKFGRKGPSKLRQQFNRGMTYFLVIVACILVYFAMLRVEAISNTLSKILSILKPVLYGCGIAYLLNPIVKSVRCISGASAGKAHEEERKSEEGFQKYRSDRGAGCIDYGCIDIDQYADTGTDHKYP